MIRNDILRILLVILVISCMVLVTACGSSGGDDPSEGDIPETEEQTEEAAPEDDPEEQDQAAETREEDGQEEVSSDIDPEFKEVVDSYETLMDEYFAFMKGYDETDPDQQEEFGVIMDRYNKSIKQIDDWVKKGLSDAEQNYLDDCYERVGEKQVEADIAMG